MEGMLMIEVNLILIGKDCWAALMQDGSVLLSETSTPRADVAMALLRQGMDPRSRLVIRHGARVIASDMLGIIGGHPVVCSDVDMVEKD
jgi:hypothetical protein